VITSDQIQEFLNCMAFGFSMALILWALGASVMSVFRFLKGAVE
jgi:hypothetical protein